MSDDVKKKLEKIEDKIDGLHEKMESINITLARNTETLIIHEKRSTINEANLELLRKEIEPIKQHVAIVNFLAKALVAVGSIFFSIKKLFF